MPKSRKPRLLIAEDNAGTRCLLEHVLQSKFDLTLAAGVDGALEAARKQKFDLFLLDINLGEERTGTDLLQSLRSTGDQQDVPAVAFTAYALPGDQEGFLEAGFDGYVSKPFTRSELVRPIETLLEEDG